MAKPIKDDAAPPKKITAADLRRVVGDIQRHKDSASEYSGLAGQASKQAIEMYGLDRAALNYAVKLSKMEAVKAQSALRATIDYCDKLGLFDQVDAFDDMIPMLRRILDRAENTRPQGGVPADPVMGTLLDGSAAKAH